MFTFVYIFYIYLCNYFVFICICVRINRHAYEQIYTILLSSSLSLSVFRTHEGTYTQINSRTHAQTYTHTMWGLTAGIEASGGAWSPVPGETDLEHKRNRWSKVKWSKRHEPELPTQTILDCWFYGKGVWGARQKGWGLGDAQHSIFTSHPYPKQDL